MDPKALLRALGDDGKSALDTIFAGKGAARTTFTQVAAEVFTEKGVAGLKLFLKQQAAAEFFQGLIGKSAAGGGGGRAENLYRVLFARLEIEIDQQRIAEVAAETQRAYFRETEKIFFMLPVDWAGYVLFLEHFVRLGEYEPELLEDFAVFMRGQSAVFIRRDYAYNSTVLVKVFESLMKVYIFRVRADALKAAGEFFNQRSVERFIRAAAELEQHGEFLQLLQKALLEKSDLAPLTSALKTYARRYLKGNEGGRYVQGVFQRFITIWPVVLRIDEMHLAAFREFLNQYGDGNDEIQGAIWDIVFTLPPEKAVLAMYLFASSAFHAVISAYGKDRKTIIFLAQNIVTALVEAEIRDFSRSLHRIALKLLLGLKVDAAFLERRAAFFAWLIEESASYLLSAEVVRFLFFEYIYIALKLVDNKRGLTMTKFCEPNHRFFCSRIDAKACAVPQYYEILERLRTRLYTPVKARFPRQEFIFTEIMNVAQSTKCEDLALAALPQIAPEHLAHYHGELLALFKKNPAECTEGFDINYWCRLTLGQAMTHVQAAAFPLVGAVRITAGEGGAYTDGKTIFLPESASWFQEKPDNERENRNLTMYVALALHEAGHLIAGTFRFNVVYYLARLEKPELFKAIHNCFEDFRIETFLRRIGAHPQVGEILACMNETFFYLRLDGEEDLAMDLIAYIYGMADGSLAPMLTRFAVRIRALFTAKVFCANHASLKELAEYGIQGLKAMDVGNPLGAYPLSREFYEIMKQWPDSDLMGLTEEGGRMTGRHIVLEETGEPQKPLTADDLQRLYAEYNRDPASFLRRNNLPVFPQLLPAREDGTPTVTETQREFVNELLARSAPSVIDESTRTAADDMLAAEQLKKKKEHDLAPRQRDIVKRPQKKKRTAKREQSYVYSVDAKTRSRTRLSQIREYPQKNVNRAFMDKMRKWRGLEEKIFRLLALLLPEQRLQDESSYFEGDVDMELLIEIIADTKKTGLAEFLEVQIEKRRSLAVVIGIDCSGSTNIVIGDVDPEDMTNIAASDPDSPGRVLVRDTPETAMKYDSIHGVEKAFALLMGRALKYLTQDVTIYGFNSATGTNVYRAETLEAASSFEPAGSNRDGDFIRYITAKLAKNPAEVKFFVLVSDGRPNADNYSGEAAVRDTMLAMRETVQKNIKFIYFNIDQVRSAYFDEFAAEATYAEYFSDPYQLLPVIPAMVREIVAAL